MSPFSDAVSTLTKVISRSRSKDKRKHSETIRQISSLLDLQQSPETVGKISRCLRQPLVQVYWAYPHPALQVASSLFHKIYHERVLTALGKQQQEEKRVWEDVLNSLLSGVLDYLDDSEADKTHSARAKDAIGVVLYPSLCDICFSLTAPMMTVDLRCTAYTILSDSAAAHKANQQKLRDKSILGGERLGSMIWRTRDYLALESLLTLFARILPSTKDTPSGDAKRSAYIKSVFLSPTQAEHENAGRDVVELLGCVSSNEWEETARKIVETLAGANVAFPQPFAIGRIKTCEQTKRSDRLYVDDKAVLVNVLIGDDQCESLQVAYTTVRKIGVVQEQTGDSSVSIRIDKPPILGKDPIVTPKESNQLRDWTVDFTILDTDVDKFHSALRSRGLGRFLKDIPPKLSLARSPAVLDFDSQGNVVKEPSQSERVENVEKFYRTNQSSDDLTENSLENHAQKPVSLLSGVPLSGPIPRQTTEKSQKGNNTSMNDAAASTSENASSSEVAASGKGSEKITSLSAHRHKTSVTSPPQAEMTENNLLALLPVSISRMASRSGKPLARTGSQKIRDQVFGTSDEELSEVSVGGSPAMLVNPSVPVRSADSRLHADKKGASVAATLPVHSTAARRVVDSDDEDAGTACAISSGAGATETRQVATVAKSKKRRVVSPCPETSDDGIFKPLEKSLVTPSRSQVQRDPFLRTPLTPTKRPVGRPISENAPDGLTSLGRCGSKTVCSHVAKKHVTQPQKTVATDGAKTVSDVPSIGLTTIASQPAPRLVAQPDNAGVEATTDNTAAMVPPAKGLADGSRMERLVGTSKRTTKIPAKALPLPTDLDGISDKILNSSSPVPIVKSECTSIKSRLRKKDQNLPEVGKTAAASYVKATKRKRAAQDDDDPIVDPDLDQDTLKPPPTKRLREEVPTVRPKTDPHALRRRMSATTRVNKQYRAKKKTSSPLSRKERIDYDELPNSANLSNPRIPSSPPVGKQTGPNHKQALKPKLGNVTARMTASTKGKKTKPPVAPLSDPAPPSGESRFEVADNALIAVEDLRDELEVNELVTGRSKPSVTLVEKPVVEALKASALSTPVADPFGTFTSPEPTSTAKPAVIRVDKQKTQSGSAKKSNKTPWLNTANATSSALAQADAEVDTETQVLKEVPSLSADMALPPSPQAASPERGPTETRPIKAHLKNEPRLPADTKPCQQASSLPRQQHVALAVTPRQIETIDLTQEDSPVRRGMAPLLIATAKRLPSLENESQMQLDRTPERPHFSTSTPFRKPGGAIHLRSTAKNARCVTFAPDVEERPPTPLAYDGKEALHASISSLKPSATKKPRSIMSTPDVKARRKHVKVIDSPRAKSPVRRKDASIQDIVDVLEELQQAIVQRISQRFEGVREEVRFGRDTLLSEAADDLLRMRAESVSHFNRLIDLEAEYAKMGRTLLGGYEELLQESQQIGANMTRMVEEHDRGSLAQQMPVHLANLPSCFRSKSK